MEKKLLREELKDEVLEAVSGGKKKKSAQEIFDGAQKKLKEETEGKRAKELMNTPYGLPGVQ